MFPNSTKEEKLSQKNFEKKLWSWTKTGFTFARITILTGFLYREDVFMYLCIYVLTRWRKYLVFLGLSFIKLQIYNLYSQTTGFVTHLFLLRQQGQHVLHVNKWTLNQPADTQHADAVLLDAGVLEGEVVIVL